MCGIAGFLDSTKGKKKIIKNMTNRIAHRGPDAEGFYTDEFVALGHRRLSIIDLSTGNQPMFNEDKNLVVVFNGEIYNYPELKEKLKKKHTFETTSDTEVLLHGYEEWGKDLPKKLRGMFAFAIWDKKNKTLFCARDNFGIKPFYYYQNDNVFMFASEIKSFLEHPSFKKEFNEKSKSYDKTVKEIENAMKDSVEHHMLSDVEVGSFLSSGVDSSYIVSLARPSKTYTVGYDIPEYNEIDYAKDLTNRLNITNVSKKITKDEYIKIIPKIMYMMDEPSSDPAAIALFFVAQLARKDVKVVLSGEGADEFFGGYNTYGQSKYMRIYNKIPYCIRHIIAKIASIFPEVRGINFLIRQGTTLEENYIGVNRVFGNNEIKKILKIKNQINNKDITAPVYEEQKGKSDIIKMQAIDINFWLIKDILQKADRMSMANSLECRVPFIDKKVFAVASSLPANYKVSASTTKVALRDAAKTVIPNESYKKKKLGFPVPLRKWMRDEDLYTEIKNTFSKDFASEFFNQNYIIKLLDQHKNEKKDNYKKVWTIYCFLKWYEIFFIENKQYN